MLKALATRISMIYYLFITFHDLYSSLTVKFCLCTRWELNKRAKNLISEF